MIRGLIVLALFLPTAALAAERSINTGSFDRVRIQGPFEVVIAPGSPGGTITGDRAAIDAVEARADGTTLTIRQAMATYDNRARSNIGGPVRIAIATPSLSSLSVIGPARVRVERMKGERVELTLNGTGAVEVGDIAAQRVAAAVIGSGAITLAGRTPSARLINSGTGTLDATELDAGELFVRLDGAGQVNASARYTAQVDNTGLGSVTVAGSAKCRVTAAAGGPVQCGAAAPAR